MLTLSLVAGLWVSLMIVILPRVLAHPHAVRVLNVQRPVRKRGRGALIHQGRSR